MLLQEKGYCKDNAFRKKYEILIRFMLKVLKETGMQVLFQEVFCSK